MEKSKGADPEDPDEYRGAAHPVFWVPPEARWPHLKAQARQSTIGQLVDKAMAGIDGQIGHGDTFHNDRHPDLKADFILANPPFNITDWGGERLRDDKRWQYGVPPAGKATQTVLEQAAVLSAQWATA